VGCRKDQPQEAEQAVKPQKTGTSEKKADAARRLLARYTNESFQSAEQWQSWFEENKDRIFFSDVGGFKFFVVPKDYIEKIRLIAEVEEQAVN
jgi:hypothetical protein